MRIQNITPIPEPDALAFAHIQEGNAVLQVTSVFHEAAEPQAVPRYAPHRLQSACGIVDKVDVLVDFDTPENNLLGRYEAWSADARLGPQCIGDGTVAKAFDSATGGHRAIKCVGPETCAHARNDLISCSFVGRLSLRVKGHEDHQVQLRTSSAASYRAMLSDLQRAKAEHGSLRNCVFTLSVEAKSSAASNYEPYPLTRLRAGQLVKRDLASPAWEAYGDAIRASWFGDCQPSQNDADPVSELPELTGLPTRLLNRPTATTEPATPASKDLLNMVLARAKTT